MSSSSRSNSMSPSPPPAPSRSMAPPGVSSSAAITTPLKAALSSTSLDQRQDSRSLTPTMPTSSSSRSLRTEPPQGRTLSCSECKRRKIKCDRACPCGPCILRNDQARCKPVIRWEAGCSLSEFTVLQNRVNELEDRVNVMQQQQQQQLPLTNGGMRALDGPLNLLSTAAGNTPKQENGDLSSSLNAGQAQTASSSSSANGVSGPRPANGEDDAVMMLEDFAMGNRANARRAAQKLVPRPGLAVRPGDSPPDLGVRLETAVNQRSADPAIDVAYRFLRLCPAPNVQRDMVQYYFERLEWQTKCLYRPNYMQDLNHFLSCRDAEAAARTVRPTFLCVHFMVICLAIHLCSGEEVAQWGYERQSAQSLCDALFAGAQQLLWASDFIGSHQLEHLQSVVLMSVYAYNVDEQADAAYALVGASIKIAQNLALNRLDDARFLQKERQKGKASGGENQLSLLDREIGKRVWWYLVWLDYSHALSHGGCYAINPAHNRTNMPANINDDDLQASVRSAAATPGASAGTLMAKPLDEYTSMSFTIWRLRFLMFYRETIDVLNAPTGMTHPQLMEMDKKLMDLLTSLPAYFQLRIDQHDSWTYGESCHDMELLSIQITAWNRLLRLHRPFLARGLYDRSNISRKRCVDAAYNILALFRHAKTRAPLLLKVWINIYYVFSGALVLFLDLCYEDGSDAKGQESKRKAIREMLDICDTARHLSAAAKNTFNLLHGLLEAETELRVHQRQKDSNTSASTKRKRKSEAATSSPFVSLVERVLVDAASKNGSGDSNTSSIGRSPSEYGGAGGLFEPPAKRHTATSFVRDRHASASGGSGPATAGVRSNSSPYALSGAGHGGYYNSQNSGTGGVAQDGLGATTTRGSGGSTYGNAPSGGSSNFPPLSPFGPSSLRAEYQGGGNSSGAWSGAGGFPSPTSFAGAMNSPSMYGNGGSGGGVESAGRNGSLSHSSGIMSSGHGAPFDGTHASMPTTGRGAATTSGLSSLLDEDIFSGLLMNQHMENNSDWESALALVAPLPTPTHGIGGTTGSSSGGGGSGSGPTPGSTTAVTPGAHQQHQQVQSSY